MIPDYTRLIDVMKYAKSKEKGLRILVWDDIIKAYKDASERDKTCYRSVYTSQIFEGQKSIVCFLHKSNPVRKGV